MRWKYGATHSAQEGQIKMLSDDFCHCLLSWMGSWFYFIIDFYASISPLKHYQGINDSAFGQKACAVDSPI